MSWFWNPYSTFNAPEEHWSSIHVRYGEGSLSVHSQRCIEKTERNLTSSLVYSATQRSCAQREHKRSRNKFCCDSEWKHCIYMLFNSAKANIEYTQTVASSDWNNGITLLLYTQRLQFIYLYLFTYRFMSISAIICTDLKLSIEHSTTCDFRINLKYAACSLHINA